MKKIFITSIVILAFVLGGYSLRPEQAVGSVEIGSGYQFKTVAAGQASATVPFVVRGGTGILGSIVITGTSTARIRVYDNALATSTATSTIIADFPASTPAGTYTYDAVVNRGIVVDVPAAHAGFYTVTYR